MTVKELKELCERLIESGCGDYDVEATNYTGYSSTCHLGEDGYDIDHIYKELLFL